MAGLSGEPSLVLGFGLALPDLYDESGLHRLDKAWQHFLAETDAALAARQDQARQAPDQLGAVNEATLLIELGAPLEIFIGQLFGMAQAIKRLSEAHAAMTPINRVKWKFVRRQAALGVSPEMLQRLDVDRVRARLMQGLSDLGLSWHETCQSPQGACTRFNELAFAQAVLRWQSDSSRYAEALQDALHYSAWAATTPFGRAYHAQDVLFQLPQTLDAATLREALDIAPAEPQRPVRTIRIAPQSIPKQTLQDRKGRMHTDPGTRLAEALDAAQYCLTCHKNQRDSCSKGLPEAAKNPNSETPTPRQPALAGCPLEERISEFLALKAQGLAIAALAMITVDNPMVAATGHRICNDCMKACIYQHQTPVDVPRAETQTLRDVLGLPWGFEIYSLLTRWNPLNLRRPRPNKASGKRVLVVGTGPAGFTLAHYLMNDGHTVVAIDGQKIEPLPASWTGLTNAGVPQPFTPIYDCNMLFESLDTRVAGGFGGVAEYGITARWDKNFLTLIRLLLERRRQFRLFGGVRFGGTLTAEEAWALGFDHIALAVGAGRPTMLNIPNGLARGVRSASDFLMTLQLGGAQRSDSLTNLQIQLPIVVVGGGLTAVDAATEALAYYPIQVEKFRARYQALVATQGVAAVRSAWSEEECSVADEFLNHAQALQQERDQAQAEGRPARILELLDRWGGVTLAYRRRITESPAYTLNHEELLHGLKEGIRVAECLLPERVEVLSDGAAHAITFIQGPASPGHATRTRVTLPARTILIAAGTHPNTALAEEFPQEFGLDGAYFQAVDEHGHPVRPAYREPKPAHPDVLLSGTPGGRWISFFGDAHPSWFGNVVKAMASAQRGWPVVARVLRQAPAASTQPQDTWTNQLQDLLSAQVVQTHRLAPHILELVVRAPLAARRFQPGQFYRLQTFEREAPSVMNADGLKTRLAPEALALTGASVDRQAGLISTIVLEMGASSRLCAQLTPGQSVILMGPTGTPTNIVGNETVVLVGGGLGNAVLFSIGAALRAAGSRVLYFAGYRTRADRFKPEQLEAAADVVVWCCEEAPGFAPRRTQDCSFVGNVVQAMVAWARGAPTLIRAHDANHAVPAPALYEADRLLVIGSNRMMAAVARARKAELAPYLKASHQAIGSINSPMQCMMKGLCGQCIQSHHDPQTGATRFVLSCVQQDQALEYVDFSVLDARLRQNTLQEKLAAQWLDLCLRSSGPHPASH